MVLPNKLKIDKKRSRSQRAASSIFFVSATYLHDDCSKLRERLVNALGRIGRADKHLIVP